MNKKIQDTKKKEVMTSAERQAKRQARLREASRQCDLLQTDIKTALAMLKSSVEALKMVALYSDDAKSLSIVFRQIEGAIELFEKPTYETSHDKPDFSKLSRLL